MSFSMFDTLFMTVDVQVLMLGFLAEIITTATHRHAEVTRSIRHVYRHDAIEGI